MAGLDADTIAMLRKRALLPPEPTPAPAPDPAASGPGGFSDMPIQADETPTAPTDPKTLPSAVLNRFVGNPDWKNEQPTPPPAQPPAPPAGPPAPGVGWQNGQGVSGAGGPQIAMPRPGVAPAQNLSTVAPETRAQTLGALQEQKGAEAEQGGAERAANAQQGQQELVNADLARISAAENEVRARDIRRKLDAHLDEQKTLDAEAAKGIDPHRAMKKLGIGGQFAAAVAAAFGAFGASLTHSQNFAQQIIDKRVNDDIDAQKLDVENAKGRAAAHRSEYAQKLQLLGDPNAAEAAAKADRYAYAAAKARYEATQTNDRILKARMSEASAAWDMKAAQYNQETHKYVQASSTGGNLASEYQKYAQHWHEGDQKIPLKPFQDWAREQLGAGSGATPQPGKPGEGPVALPPVPKSTNWNPLRNLQGTQGQHDLLNQQAYNAAIMGIIHKQYGARTPEAQEHIGAGYIVQPGDSQETIRIKAANARRDFGHLMGQGGEAPPDVDSLVQGAGEEP